MKGKDKKMIAGLVVSVIVLGIMVSVPLVVAVIPTTIVSIPDASADPGSTVTVSIKISDVTDMCGANVWLNYNKNVVTVESISNGDLGSITYSIDNDAGVIKMNWDTTTGMTGDFAFVYITLKAVGSPGDTSPLDLDVKELYDCNLDDITHTIADGTFTIPSVAPTPTPTPTVIPTPTPTPTVTPTPTITPTPAPGTIVSIKDATAPKDSSVTVPIKIKKVTDMCGANIWLNYNKNVVIVESVSNGNLGTITYSIDNDAGVAKMNWDTTTGMTGDFVFAYITLKAVGNSGDTSPLDLDVKELYDCNLDDITHTIADGTFTIPPVTPTPTPTPTVTPTPTPTPGPQAVTRTLPSGTQTAGSSITVSLAVVTGGADYYIINEVVPSGWTVTSASGGGNFILQPGHVIWTVLSGATDTTYTYTVTIPVGAAGDYTFTGTYMMEGMTAEATIGGDNTVTVGLGPTPTPTPSPNKVYLDPQDSSARHCNTVKVKIWANTTEKIGYGQINLTYTHCCANVTSWSYGPLWQGTWDSSINGIEWLVFTRPFGQPTVSGTVLIGTLTIHCCNTSDCITPLTFSSPSKLSDPASGALTVTWKDGTFKCRQVMCGDVNCDGVVDVEDAGKLLFYVGFPGHYTICSEWAADVNCDGVIDVEDAGKLLFYVGFPGHYRLKCC